MPTLRTPALAATVILFALSALSAPAQTASAPPAALDSTLYTTYSLSSGDQNLSLSVCGSLPGSEGCYGGAFLGPFGKIGALLEGNPSTSGNTVTRAIYVVDIAAGTTGTGVNLNIFKKTDSITSSNDTVAVTLFKTISLPLTGGSAAVCSMAANAGFLFIGTDQSPQGVEVKKGTGTVTLLGGFSPPSTSPPSPPTSTVTSPSRREALEPSPTDSRSTAPTALDKKMAAAPTSCSAPPTPSPPRRSPPPITSPSSAWS